MHGSGTTPCGSWRNAVAAGFADAIEFEDITTPVDWQARGWRRCTFSAAHLLFQTGPLRSSNHWGANAHRFGHAARVGGTNGPGERSTGRRTDHGVTRPTIGRRR